MASLAPEFEVRRVGSGLRASGRIPEDLVHLEGHFPGLPVLPGVVQLHWAIGLAREHLAPSGAPSALEALKFREPLLPGARFELRVDVAGVLRFEVLAGEKQLSSGRVRFEDEPAQHTGVALPAMAPGPWPLCIPHQGPMRWIERVLAHDADTTLCQARIGNANGLCDEGFAPSWLALELLAQGMAAQGGIAAGEASGRRGLLVGARRVELRTRGFEADEGLWVHVRHLRGETGFVQCECSLGTGRPPSSPGEAGDLALARGTLTAFVESAKD